MSTITDIVDGAMQRASADIITGKVDLRSIIYMAVQAGMADAYSRGIEIGKGMAPVIQEFGA